MRKVGNFNETSNFKEEGAINQAEGRKNSNMATPSTETRNSNRKENAETTKASSDSTPEISISMDSAQIEERDMTMKKEKMNKLTSRNIEGEGLSEEAEEGINTSEEEAKISEVEESSLKVLKMEGHSREEVTTREKENTEEEVNTEEGGVNIVEEEDNSEEEVEVEEVEVADEILKMDNFEST